jgi:hypothetical protein
MLCINSDKNPLHFNFIVLVAIYNTIFLNFSENSPWAWAKVGIHEATWYVEQKQSDAPIRVHHCDWISSTMEGEVKFQQKAAGGCGRLKSVEMLF